MKEHECSYIFLATEDKEILANFIEAFGEKLLYLPQRRYSQSDLHDKMYLAEAKDIDTSRNRIEDARTYLAAIYLLSKCNCFIGGRTGGTKGVLLMEHQFEYKLIYNLGIYK